MKAKGKFLFFIVVASVVMGFTSCLEDTGNKRSYSAVPAYVTSDMMGNVILENYLGYGSLYAPALTGQPNVSAGDYILCDLSIDLDKPMTNGKYTADVSNWSPIEKSDLWMDKISLLEGSYNDSISVIEPLSYLLLNKSLLLAVGHKCEQNRKYSYTMVCDPDSSAKYGKPAVYLKSEIVTPGTGMQAYYYFYHAFDVAYLMGTARDTTLQGVDFYHKEINLYYQTSKDATGKAVFTSYKNNPISIYEEKIKN